jgi:hypothetical protein
VTGRAVEVKQADPDDVVALLVRTVPQVDDQGNNTAFTTEIAVDRFTPMGWGQLLAQVLSDIADWLPGDADVHRRAMLTSLATRLASIQPRKKSVV